MNSITRILVFLFLCIGTRLALSAVTYKYPNRVLAIPLLLIGGSFFYLFFSGQRPVGIEAGGVIWWAHVRPIHGALYLLAGTLLFTSHSHHAYVPLLIDVGIGLAVWANHRIIQQR